MKLRIKELRKRAGYKNRQEFVAALGEGYTVRKVSSWETGERMLSLEQACDIADLLGCTLDELAGRDFSPPEYSDPFQAELNRCYEASTADRRRRIVETARDAAGMSRDVPERSSDVA